MRALLGPAALNSPCAWQASIGLASNLSRRERVDAACDTSLATRNLLRGFLFRLPPEAELDFERFTLADLVELAGREDEA